MKLSVIICAYNPRTDHLHRVLEALRGQTLPKDDWELVVVDNASAESLSGRLDLAWHPRARCVLEGELGLAHARLRGILETTGEILLFVDQDNVLDNDYLAQALAIGERFPLLGAWGGRALPEFEVPPPDWFRPYVRNLAIRDFKRDQWANLGYDDGTVPSGAGMVVRRQVAQRYSAVCQGCAKRELIGRKGNSLAAFEDIDLACASYELGWGTGIFVCLKLTHLIPACRLKQDYLERLLEAMTYSDQLFRWIHGLPLRVPVRSQLRRFLGKLRRRLTMGSLDRRLWEAQMRGRERAQQQIARQP